MKIQLIIFLLLNILSGLLSLGLTFLCFFSKVKMLEAVFFSFCTFIHGNIAIDTYQKIKSLNSKH